MGCYPPASKNCVKLFHFHGFAHRGLQWPASVRDRHAASQNLGRRQRNPADIVRISLRRHFDDDLFICPCAQYGIDWWQSTAETYIHDTAADGRDHTGIG